MFIIIVYVVLFNYIGYYFVSLSVVIYRFFTGLLLRFRADISKVTVHERIQHLCFSFVIFIIFILLL
jgi:hypothetical protein